MFKRIWLIRRKLVTTQLQKILDEVAAPVKHGTLVFPFLLGERLDLTVRRPGTKYKLCNGSLTGA